MRVDRKRTISVIVSLIALLFVVSTAVGEGNGRRARAAITKVNEDVSLTSPVLGSVELLGGSAYINSVVDGDVVVIGGSVELGPAARINGDIFCLGGQIKGFDESRVRGDIFPPTAAGEIQDLSGRPVLNALDRPLSFASVALKLALLVGWLIVGVAVATVFGRELRVSSLELSASPIHSLALGLVAFTSFVLTAIVFSYLIPFLVGIPLLVFLGLFAILTKVYGMIAVFHMIGSRVFRGRTPEELQSRKWFRGDIAMVIGGLLILGLVRLIPFVGTFLWVLSSMLGVGVALSTKFGRREPWFLALSPIRS